MRFTMRKAEKEAVAEVLAEQTGTIEDAAKAAWDESLSAFLKREFFVLLVVDKRVSPIPFVHGPFPTAAAANKAISNGEVFAASEGVKGVVVRMNSRELDAYQAEAAEGLW